MSASNIVESKLRKCVVIIVTCSIIFVLYKLNVFIIILLYLEVFFMCLILVLVSAFFVVVFLPFCVWTVGPNLSLTSTFMTDGTLFINIFSIVVLFCALLRKFNSVRWWVSCPWIIALVLIKKLVCLYHVFVVVSIPLGVIIFQFLNKPAIFLPVTLTN